MSAKSAEENMWWDDTAEGRISECIKDALDDREALLKWWADGVAMIALMHESHVTLCDNGCVIDIAEIINGFEPHDVSVVAARAHELAVDRENW